MYTVGFVGLGRMGWPMARNIVAAGFPLVGYDADAEITVDFVAENRATAAVEPADFAAVDVVVTMLPTGRIVREALLDWGDGGIAAHLQPGSVLVDMSSSEPVGTRELGGRLRGRGIGMVDAPVSGGVEKATDGTLAIMLGTDDAAASIERAVQVIDAMSARIFRTGPLGSGHAMKALNNYVAAAGFTAGCEALNAGREFGLEPEVMVEVLNSSTGRNFSTEDTFVKHVLTERYDTGFTLGLMTKDVGIAADLAEELGLPAPVCAAVHARLRDAAEGIGGSRDHSAAITHWAKHP
ncbi:MAG: NAD-binding protein [Pseudonocardiaceae bacterium]|nr:NAD-binding protein [Pseudonocardiaceae bacterium]